MQLLGRNWLSSRVLAGQVTGTLESVRQSDAHTPFPPPALPVGSCVSSVKSTKSERLLTVSEF